MNFFNRSKPNLTVETDPDRRYLDYYYDHAGDDQSSTSEDSDSDYSDEDMDNLDNIDDVDDYYKNENPDDGSSGNFDFIDSYLNQNSSVPANLTIQGVGYSLNNESHMSPLDTTPIDGRHIENFMERFNDDDDYSDLEYDEDDDLDEYERRRFYEYYGPQFDIQVPNEMYLPPAAGGRKKRKY